MGKDNLRSLRLDDLDIKNKEDIILKRGESSDDE